MDRCFVSLNNLFRKVVYICQLFVYIFQSLEEKERKSTAHRDNLLREQRYLRRRLELLSTQVDAIHKRRSVSECSTSTVSSSHSSHSESGRSIFRLYLLRNFLLDDTRNFTLRLAYFNRFTKMIKNCSKKSDGRRNIKFGKMSKFHMLSEIQWPL